MKQLSPPAKIIRMGHNFLSKFISTIQLFYLPIKKHIYRNKSLYTKIIKFF